MSHIANSLTGLQPLSNNKKSDRCQIFCHYIATTVHLSALTLPVPEQQVLLVQIHNLLSQQELQDFAVTPIYYHQQIPM